MSRSGRTVGRLGRAGRMMADLRARVRAHEARVDPRIHEQARRHMSLDTIRPGVPPHETMRSWKIVQAGRDVGRVSPEAAAAFRSQISRELPEMWSAKFRRLSAGRVGESPFRDVRKHRPIQPEMMAMAGVDARSGDKGEGELQIFSLRASEVTEALDAALERLRNSKMTIVIGDDLLVSPDDLATAIAKPSQFIKNPGLQQALRQLVDMVEPPELRNRVRDSLFGDIPVTRALQDQRRVLMADEGGMDLGTRQKANKICAPVPPPQENPEARRQRSLEIIESIRSHFKDDTQIVEWLDLLTEIVDTSFFSSSVEAF